MADDIRRKKRLLLQVLFLISILNIINESPREREGVRYIYKL